MNCKIFIKVAKQIYFSILNICILVLKDESGKVLYLKQYRSKHFSIYKIIVK